MRCCMTPPPAISCAIAAPTWPACASAWPSTSTTRSSACPATAQVSAALRLGCAAGAPARRGARAVGGPPGNQRRQRAGGDVRRARLLRRLFPAGGGSDPLRRGQFHLPRGVRNRRRRGGQGGGRRRKTRARKRKAKSGPVRKQSPAKALQIYAINLNEKAAKGLIDPLVGRKNELERAIHVLLRRRKNNPIFVGEAGVGKTAIVEGLGAGDPSRRRPARRFAIARFTRWIWARCWPAHGSAATSSSA